MRIQELNLKNFKRFTDLVIKNIPSDAKLVLLIGANGSGKSAVFDAFDWVSPKRIDKNLSSAIKNLASDKENKERLLNEEEYYKKNTSKETICEIIFTNGIKYNLSDNPNKERLKPLPIQTFFGRPSMRIVPILQNRGFNETSISENSDGPEYFIDFDTRFQNDVKKFTRDISKSLRDPLFAGNLSVDLVKIAQQFIEPVNTSLEQIFGKNSKTNIRLSNYEDAGTSTNEPPKLIFSKGNSTINYDLLSHGEKQVIVILLNFIVRSHFFKDTIYYIDEMDVHLNTSLQYSLIKEITENWIPENCQLWTASHSLGFIEYAKDTDHSVIIDFDNFDFDEKQEIEPAPKNLDNIFEIAIPRNSIAKILGNRKVVLCENKNYELYSIIGLEDFVFTDVQNSNSVFLKIKRDSSLIGLRDRDFLTENEIKTLKDKFPNYKILKYYCFENYLYHPENVEKLNLKGFNKENYKNEITEIKEKNRHNLILKVSESRKSYEEFRDGGIKQGSDIEQISKYIESDDFDKFFVFLSFKDYCLELTHKYKIDKKEMKEKLVQTEWFKNKISEILR